MLSSQVGTCSICAREFWSPKPKQTLYCRFCRISKDLQFFGDKGTTRRCTICDARFMPIRRGDSLCGGCRICGEGRGSVKGECVACESGGVTLLHTDIPVCGTCARDPKLRKQINRNVGKKTIERRAATPAAIEDCPPETKQPPKTADELPDF